MIRSPNDPDEEIRAAALAAVEEMRRTHHLLPSSLIDRGFACQGTQIPLVTPMQGICKPRQMNSLLSIRTSSSGKRKYDYDDQAGDLQDIFSQEQSIDFSFNKFAPSTPMNQALRDASERCLPIIYFVSVAPQLYEVFMPVFLHDWDPATRKVRVAFSPARSDGVSRDDIQRRYAMTQAKRRLHQSIFRDRVMTAYNGRCAFTGLREARLVDAAHIIPDADELGHPRVSNGMPLTKLHHAALDANLIGLDPDGVIHVSERLLSHRSDPAVQALTRLDGQPMRPPRNPHHAPSKDLLDRRFMVYRAAQ